LFFNDVSDATTPMAEEKRAQRNEYKSFYMIKDYMPILHQAIQKNTQAISKILSRLFHLLEKNSL